MISLPFTRKLPVQQYSDNLSSSSESRVSIQDLRNNSDPFLLTKSNVSRVRKKEKYV